MPPQQKKTFNFSETINNFVAFSDILSVQNLDLGRKSNNQFVSQKLKNFFRIISKFNLSPKYLIDSKYEYQYYYLKSNGLWNLKFLVIFCFYFVANSWKYKPYMYYVLNTVRNRKKTIATNSMKVTIDFLWDKTRILGYPNI